MATFQFSNSNYIELNFCDQLSIRLLFNNETQKRMQAVSTRMMQKSEEMKGDKTQADLDELCDYVMDAIDDVLGEEMADQIMALKGEEYTFFDALDVFMYISGEINSEAKRIMSQYGGEASNGSQKNNIEFPARQRMNRAQRRAAARAGK